MLKVIYITKEILYSYTYYIYSYIKHSSIAHNGVLYKGMNTFDNREVYTISMILRYLAINKFLCIATSENEFACCYYTNLKTLQSMHC